MNSKEITKISKEVVDYGGTAIVSGAWISVDDALPTDFELGWVIGLSSDGMTYSDGNEVYNVPDVMEYRKDGLWHKKNDYNSPEDIHEWNKRFPVRFWRPIDGFLPKNIKGELKVRVNEIYDAMAEYKDKYPQVLRDYIKLNYNDKEYEDKEIIYSALRFGHITGRFGEDK